MLQTNIEVQWQKKEKHLSEIYQHTKMIFAFLSSQKDGYKQCHDFVQCRDFLHDAVRTQITGIKSNIFGFVFEKNVNPPIDLEKTRLLVSRKNLTEKEVESFTKKMLCSTKIVNHFEEIMNEEKTICEQIISSNNGLMWLFTGPKIWMKTPFLVSMYTLLIRIGDKQVEFQDEATLKEALKKISEDTYSSDDNDHNYLKVLHNKLHTIAKNIKNLIPIDGDTTIDLFQSKLDINYFHNYCGIYNICMENTSNKTLKEKLNALFNKKD